MFKFNRTLEALNAFEHDLEYKCRTHCLNYTIKYSSENDYFKVTLCDSTNNRCKTYEYSCESIKYIVTAIHILHDMLDDFINNTVIPEETEVQVLTKNEHNPAWLAYNRLLNALHDPKATKSDLAIAIEEAVGYLGEALDE